MRPRFQNPPLRERLSNIGVRLMLPNMELSGASRKWRLLGVKRFYFPVLELVTEEDIEKKKNSKNPKKLQRKRFHQGEQKRDDTRFILTTNKYDEFSL